MRYILVFLLLLQFSILSPLPVRAQRVAPRPVAPLQDTLSATGQDTLTIRPKGDLETTIKYSASDSIIFEVGQQNVHLYRDAKINYGTMSLDAGYISINYDSTTLKATTLPDSTGKEAGTPVFVNGSEKYAAKRINYNYKTRKGRIAQVVTQQGEGFVHAELIKKNEQDDFYGLHAMYTTCNLEHPHFYISANKIAKADNKVMSGPFNLVIGDIPTPLGFLFGLFPIPQGTRSSGVIIPTFGETRLRGFALRNGGYYFAWNDYIGTRLTGSIYSLGGFDLNLTNTYNKRYAFNGNFDVGYTSTKLDEADLASLRSDARTRNLISDNNKSFWVNWRHTPYRKPGQGTFTANVRLGSQSYQNINPSSTADYLAATFNSSVTYQKNIENTPFSYTMALSQSQDRSGNMNFVLPDLNFSMSQVSFSELLSSKPLTGKWYEKFQLGYNLRVSNRVSNLTRPRSLSGVNIIGATSEIDTIPLNDFSRLWENGERSANHTFQIGLGNYKVLRYFNFTPSVSYAETWLDEKYTYSFDPDSQKVRVDTTNFGRIYNYNAGASLSTAIYGTYNFKKGSHVQAIRHTIRPNVGYSYRPDFGATRYGFYQNVQTGIDTVTMLPVYTNLGRFGSNLPGTGLQSALTFSVQQNLEMKVRSKNDSTDNKYEKVSLIDNLSLSGSYNFAADAYKLSNINMNMSTKLLKTFNLRLNASFDPYKYDSLGTRLNEYAFDATKLKLATLTNAQFALSASLNPSATRSSTAVPTNLPSLQQDTDPLVPQYIDFKIPWTLSLDYTINYRKGIGFNTVLRQANPNAVTQTLGLNGTLSLTEKWQINYTTGYDFTNNNISYTTIGINRDLHCWAMNISWTPIGGFQQGYYFTINAKSSLLRDLKLSKRSTSNPLR